MPDWSIKIVAGENPGDPAAFVPDLEGANPGDPLVASRGDLVSWNNTTRDRHRPWPAGSDFAPVLPESSVPRQSKYYLSDPIPPDDSSRPSWVVSPPASGNTIFYCCLLHPEEHGQIQIATS